MCLKLTSICILKFFCDRKHFLFVLHRDQRKLHCFLTVFRQRWQRFSQFSTFNLGVCTLSPLFPPTANSITLERSFPSGVYITRALSEELNENAFHVKRERRTYCSVAKVFSNSQNVLSQVDLFWSQICATA